MSQENVGIVKVAYEALASGGLDPFMEHFTDDVEYRRYGGRARLSGVETGSALWTVFNIRDGKIARGREYATREQALEAAGLSE